MKTINRQEVSVSRQLMSKKFQFENNKHVGASIRKKLKDKKFQLKTIICRKSQLENN